MLWNDVFGPRHLFNIWLGRLMSPQINSFGLHSSYINDTFLPAVTVAGLYNPSASFTLGQGHSDGVETNGIIAHRVDWSLGWIASSVASGLGLPNAESRANVATAWVAQKFVSICMTIAGGGGDIPGSMEVSFHTPIRSPGDIGSRAAKKS